MPINGQFYEGWKNRYPVDSAIRPSYNRPMVFSDIKKFKKINIYMIISLVFIIRKHTLKPDLHTTIFHMIVILMDVIHWREC